MKLYLVRHGEALSEQVDPECGLSDRGKSDVAAVAAHLAELGVAPARIQHSTKARARQTAAIIAGAIGGAVQPEEREGIAPNDNVVPIAEEIAESRADLMLVGHLPFMPRLAQALLGAGAPGGIAALMTGGVLILEGGGEGWTFIRRITPGEL